MDETKSGSSVKSLQVALDVIEAIAEGREEVGISELASRLGLTKGSLYRYMRTLTERGYLRQNPITSRYGLGTRLHVLGEIAADTNDLLSVSDPIMRQLRDEVSLTINLARATPRGVEIMKSMVGTLLVEIGLRIGAELPYSSTSQGRAIMAFSRRPILQGIRRQKLPRYTDYTLTEFDQIEAKVATARERGWADAPQETYVGINAVSVPLFEASGECIAALALVGSVQHLRDPPEPEQLSHLFDAGQRISAGLGFRSTYPRLSI